LILLSSNLPHQ